jgi:hypothetical protein
LSAQNFGRSFRLGIEDEDEDEDDDEDDDEDEKGRIGGFDK